MAVCVTFNNDTGYIRINEQFINDEKSRDFNILMSVLTRVYSVVFDTSFSSAKQIVKDHIGILDKTFLKDFFFFYLRI